MNLFCCCTMAPNTRVTRKWELFAGRNRFYCDGMLMSAPHTGVFYFTCVLITGTSALFFVFDCPYLATKITPAIPIVGAVLYFFTMSSLLRTTFTDPGVIPRASHDEAAYIEKQIEVPNSLNSPTYRPPPRTKEVLVKGQTVKLKYCFTCKIFRPPRASHCSLCDNCVDRFDHHCPWVGNCVGKRNYRFFYMFLVSLAFLAVFIFSCSITHIVLLMKMEQQEAFEVIKKAPFSVIVTFICFFSIWSVIGLAGFHTYLTTSDQTTNEDLKGSFSSKGGQRAINPYSRGNICLNCFHILCGPMTPSLIDRRGIASDDYIIQMQQNIQSNPRLPLNEVITQSGMVTNQPMINITSSDSKPRLYEYDETNPSSLVVYRPPSYDNLQNGNSNSLAHLVENEIPLSNMDGPPPYGVMGSSDNSAIITPMSPDDDNIETIHITNNSRVNNLSGSYNNLFRDNLDNSNYERGDGINNSEFQINFNSNSNNISNINSNSNSNSNIDNNNSNINSNSNSNNNNNDKQIATTNCSNIIMSDQKNSTILPSTSLSPSSSSNVIQKSKIIGSSNSGINNVHSMPKSASDSENVYSNIPNSNSNSNSNFLNQSIIGKTTIAAATISTTTTPTSSTISNSNNFNNKSDPSLHVYSNLIDERHHVDLLSQTNEQLIITSTTAMSNSIDKSILTALNSNNLINNPYNNNRIDDLNDSSALMSSTLLSDDLDLDDPVSAFVLNSRKKATTSKAARIKKNSESDMEMSQSIIVVSSGSGNNTNTICTPGPSTSASACANTATNNLCELSLSNNCNSNSNCNSNINSNLIISATAMPTNSIAQTATIPTNTTISSNTIQMSTSTGILNSNRDNSDIITPSRLRLLHDTTMIDTALDLDSLDGSSIGNNSQVCLVKTAIV